MGEAQTGIKKKGPKKLNFLKKNKKCDGMGWVVVKLTNKKKRGEGKYPEKRIMNR